MEDKKISEMAELLCKGVKMLSQYCPECRVPLFKDGDRIFCPSCGRDVIFENSELTEKSIKVPQETKGSLCQESIEVLENEKNEESEILKSLKSVKKAILKICSKMGRENDLSTLEKEVKLVKELIEIYDKLRELE